MPDQGLSVYPLRNPLIRLLGLGFRVALVFLLSALLLACARVDQHVDAPSDVPSRAVVADVPLIKQKDYYCGPASLAMVLQWSGMSVTQADIAAQAFTPGARGTYLADMTGAARRRGQLAVGVSTFSELLDEIAAGHPVIVFQNLGLKWAPRWHFAVAVGYDLSRGEIILHSGEHERMVMDMRLFLRTWQRGDHWSLVVLPPDRLPATENQWEILRAAAALERLGHAGAAAQVYAKGASRWPGNWLWPYGLGNARYRQGDLQGARRAFEKAAQIDPTIPEIQKNLRTVIQELASPV